VITYKKLSIELRILKYKKMLEIEGSWDKNLEKLRRPEQD
jgi:hypothetical protein